ncbi:MAG: alpha/beta hydrolase [Variovorax sp.]|nr:alpha/beta hydrolase [Variovorax sp.]
MTQPALEFVACADARGSHRMAYWQWGDPAAAHVVLCMHGLTRQGRDFDVLAQALLARAEGGLRVVCPDVVGRGRSDWLADPMGYQVPQYAADMVALLAQLHAAQPIERLDVVGTSMGGLIGMVLAGHAELPLAAPVRRLVLNDVGPTIEAGAIARIASYVGQGGRYASVQAAADAMWELSTTFGPHTPEQWLALSVPMVVPASARSTDGRTKVDEAAAAAGDGAVVLHYDPAIALAIRAITPEIAAQAEAATWALYDGIRAPTLLTRGAQSDLLSAATARQMGDRGPKARLVEFAGVGHAPTFVDPRQSAVVVSFLLD